MSAIPTLRVAIVGGGPGGLTLACILKQIASSTTQRNLSFKVFEMEPSRGARSQGGMLDIHKTSGQLALKQAGVFDEFKKHMRVDATEVCIRDKEGKVHFHQVEEGTHKLGGDEEEIEYERPEIDRRVLRSILLDALPVESIEWGKKLVDLSTSPVIDDQPNNSEHKFNLHFADGSSCCGFDMVVGADGTWSKVRSSADRTGHPTSHLDPTKPPFSGIVCVAAVISDAPTRQPDIANYVGKGSCFTLGKTSGVFSQLNGDGSLRSYFLINANEDWLRGGSKEEGDAQVRSPQTTINKVDFVEQWLPQSEWCSEARQLLLQHDADDLLVRPLYEYPPGHRWTSPIAGITLLGDAAHVMTPFGGIGVNLAMNDALDLSVAIQKILADSMPMSEALRLYEDEMYKRATISVVMTLKNREISLGKRGPGNTSLGNDGVENVVKRMAEIMAILPEP